MAVEFYVPGEPVAQPRGKIVRPGNARFGAVVVPKSHPVHSWKSLVAYAASQAAHGKLLDGPLRLSVHFNFTLPASKQRKREPISTLWKDTKPDTDNLVKALKDALKNVVWHDDGQVAAYGEIQKVYVAPPIAPGTWVLVEQITRVPVVHTGIVGMDALTFMEGWRTA